MKIKVFLVIESIIYISFLWMDLFEESTSNGSVSLKFIGIFLCLLFVLAMKKEDGYDNDIWLMRIALLFTVLADLFILVLEVYEPGLVCFIVVQLCYLFRVRYGKPSRWYLNFFFVFAVLITMFIVQRFVDLLIVLACFYFVCLLRNVLESVKSYNQNAEQKKHSFRLPQRQRGLFMIGMILFLLCDINVALFNLSSYFALSGGIYQTVFGFSSIAMWFFYLPSQVVLTLSVIVKKC